MIELAALLHDVLDKKYVAAAQAADPYAFFRPFFDGAASASGLDLVADGRARLIARIVDNVSWSTEKKRLAAGQIEDWHRECVELHCVQDADRLDAIGAFGECRVHREERAWGCDCNIAQALCGARPILLRRISELFIVCASRVCVN